MIHQRFDITKLCITTMSSSTSCLLHSSTCWSDGNIIVQVTRRSLIMATILTGLGVTAGLGLALP